MKEIIKIRGDLCKALNTEWLEQPPIFLILNKSMKVLICSVLVKGRFFSMKGKREMSVKVKLFFIFLKPIDPPG